MASYNIPTPDHNLWFTVDQINYPVPMDPTAEIVPVLVAESEADISKKDMVAALVMSGRTIRLKIGTGEDGPQNLKLPAGVYRIARNVPGTRAKAYVVQLSKM